MGFNDSYMQALSQILLMIPLPNVNRAYDMLICDEIQKAIAVTTDILGSAPNMNLNISNFESTTLYIFRYLGNHSAKRNYIVQCEFCKLKGHSKENCYKLELM